MTPVFIRMPIVAARAGQLSGAFLATPGKKRMPRVLPTALMLAAATLLLGCGDNGRENGEVAIATSFAPADNCPSIAWAVAAPAQTSVGGSIAVTASASDPDPGDVLSYSWSPADAFQNPGLPSTSYLCSSSGPKTLSLAVSDHHRPSPCVSTATLRITCVAGEPGPGM